MIRKPNRVLPNNDHQITESESSYEDPERVGIGGLVVGGGFSFYCIYVITVLVCSPCRFINDMVGYCAIFTRLNIFGSNSSLNRNSNSVLTSYLFIFIFLLNDFSVDNLRIAHLFGLNSSFDNAWGIVWLIVKLMILGGMAFAGIISFAQAIKEEISLSFFKKVGFIF